MSPFDCALSHGSALPIRSAPTLGAKARFAGAAAAPFSRNVSHQ